MADPVTHEDTEELVGAPRGSVQDTLSCKGIEGGLQASGIVSESVAHKLAYSDLLFHNVKTSRNFYNILKLKEFFKAVVYCLAPGIMEYWNVGMMILHGSFSFY